LVAVPGVRDRALLLEAMILCHHATAAAQSAVTHHNRRVGNCGGQAVSTIDVAGHSSASNVVCWPVCLWIATWAEAANGTRLTALGGAVGQDLVGEGWAYYEAATAVWAVLVLVPVKGEGY
jgi:hypothetical protein